MALKNSDRPLKAGIIKTRLLILILGVLCPVTCYISRQNVGIAILSMVNTKQNHNNSTAALSSNHSISVIGEKYKNGLDLMSCPHPKIIGSEGIKKEISVTETYGPRYDWSVSDKSVIFETFFLGYTFLQIPASRLAETLGTKWILAGIAFGSSALSLLSPLAASIHVYAFAFLRGLLGICQAAMLPACFILFTEWLPPGERQRAIPLLPSGTYLGSIVASAVTGYFSEHEFLGWPWAFYMPSILCFVWGVVWISIGASRPRDHWFISHEELDYIESMMDLDKSNERRDKRQISWTKLLITQSGGIWAMMVAFFAGGWSQIIYLILLPQYLSDVLHISPFLNGLINSTIYVLFIITAPIVGTLSGWMVENKVFGFTSLQTRKLFECIALFSQAICFIALSMIGCNIHLALCVLFAQKILISFVMGGDIQLPAELSQDFAGTILALGNCVGSTVGFVAPRVHSWIVSDTRNRSQWNSYFYLAASISAAGGLYFLIFGKNNLHDFSKDDSRSTKSGQLKVSPVAQ